MRDDQTRFVAQNIWSIAESQFGFDEPNDGHWDMFPHGIYDGVPKAPAGFGAGEVAEPAAAATRGRCGQGGAGGVARRVSRQASAAQNTAAEGSSLPPGEVDLSQIAGLLNMNK